MCANLNRPLLHGAKRIALKCERQSVICTTLERKAANGATRLLAQEHQSFIIKQTVEGHQISLLSQFEGSIALLSKD